MAPRLPPESSLQGITLLALFYCSAPTHAEELESDENPRIGWRSKKSACERRGVPMLHALVTKTAF